ncbi:MAG: GGDEF domain-containing protein [Lachnospiraceae bacterium]|nr:GGDEF domain-containing protein [Lachnospiraceae bacterium]MBR1568979.1 GGDEF domain-containing protein [Lachnospiraceae bacterium]
MKGNNIKQAVFIVATVLISLGLVFLAGLLITSPIDTRNDYQYVNMSESWYTFDSFDPSISMRIFHNVTSDDYMNLDKNGTYTIYSTIPEYEPAKEAPCLFLKGQSCGIQIYIDSDDSNYNNSENELIYEANMDLYKKDAMIPRSIHFIALPPDSQGKQIAIVFHSGKDNTGIVTKDIRYGRIDELARLYAQSKRYVIILGEFMLAFGVILILLPIVMQRKQDIVRNLFQGLLLLDLGIYVSCFNDIFVYIFPNDTFSITTEFLTLLAIPLLIHATMISGESQNRFIFNKIFLGLDILILIVISILHFTNVLPINEAGTIIHLYIGLCGLYTVFRIIYVDVIKLKQIGSDRYGNIADRVINIGLSIMIVLFYIELILWKAGLTSFSYKTTDIRGVCLMFGGVIFIGCIILSYFFHTVATMRKDDISEKLQGLAYTDELTGLSNRAFCDRILEEYQLEQKDAIVISLDLDGLKVINDTCSHQAGDQYICGFSDILKDAFANAPLVGRMGGDEFIVLLSGLDILRCEGALSNLARTIDQHNADHTPCYAYSYGYATTKENSGSGYQIHQTYMLADQRMYRMKEEHHKQMHDREVE